MAFSCLPAPAGSRMSGSENDLKPGAGTCSWRAPGRRTSPPSFGRGGSLPPRTDGRLVERGETFAPAARRATGASSMRPPVSRTEQSSAARTSWAPCTHRRVCSSTGRRFPVSTSRPRMLAVPVGSTRSLVAGATREITGPENPEQPCANAFLIGGPLALLLASLAGYALRPVPPCRPDRGRCGDEPRRSRTSSLDERLPVADNRPTRSRGLGQTLKRDAVPHRGRSAARATVSSPTPATS